MTAEEPFAFNGDIKVRGKKLKRLTKHTGTQTRQASSQPQVDTIRSKRSGGFPSMKFLGGLFALVFLASFGVLFLSNSNNVESIKGATTFTTSQIASKSIEIVDEVWQPELKHTDNYTGFLVMGIDSRNVLFEDGEFIDKDRDIDSIIQVVYNHETNETLMLSIPRDSGVTSVDECINQNYYRSVNHIYKLAQDGGCPEGGEKMMMKYVTDITGFDNHYFSIITYDVFKDLINELGETENGEQGLYIDVPREIHEYYPRDVGEGFEYVYFPKGLQFIPSNKLLKYARSRKASSDFDRAARQQQVLQALFARVFDSDLTKNPSKAYSIYKAFSSNALFSTLTIDDMKAGLDLARKFDDGKVYRVVLDDEFLGKNEVLTRPSYSRGLHNRPGYYLSPIDWNSEECVAQGEEYCVLHQHLQDLYADPDKFIVTYEAARA